jgi:hypothetical protein
LTSASISSSTLRQLVDDDAPLPARQRLHRPARAQRDRAAPGLVGLAQLLGGRDDLSAAGKIRPRQALEDIVQRGARVPDDVRRGGRDLPQVVRRNARREADRDAEGAVQQAERHARRQQLRLVELAVVVPDEVDRALADLGQHQLGIARKARLGVAVGRGRVAVARAEVALSLDQRIAHRERLREVHHGVVGRAVAVRVVLAEHFADVARALGEAVRAGLAHGVQDAALHRLEAVGNLRQRARLDGRDRVAEVGLGGVPLDRRGVVSVIGGEQVERVGIHRSVEKRQLFVGQRDGELHRRLRLLQAVGLAVLAGRLPAVAPVLARGVPGIERHAP